MKKEYTPKAEEYQEKRQIVSAADRLKAQTSDRQGLKPMQERQKKFLTQASGLSN